MNELVERLEQIYELLEQIHVITTNHTTILLQSQESQEEVEQALDMIDHMISYKDELITQVMLNEQEFDKAYSKHKGKITAAKDVEVFKEWVERILKTKNVIVEAEQNNVVIMQGLARKHNKPITICKKPQEVTDAYRKQQNKI